MELLSSLIPYLQGLLASTLVLVALLSGTARQLIVSYFPAPVLQQAVGTTTTSSRHIVVASTTASTKVASSTQKAISTKKSALAAILPIAITPVAQNLPPFVPPDQVNTDARKSIVNIICTMAMGGYTEAISGSGVMIDARGIILTNAHVAQYFLLRDYPSKDATNCVIRTGSPAQNTYRATLLYLPPAWVDANASQIKAEHAMGTGEYDFAFLLITSPTNPNGSLPSSFDHFAMSGITPNSGDSALIAGYPAGFLDGITLEKSLYPTSAFTAIGQLYSFNSKGTVDAISLGGTVVAQGGASGGAVVRSYDGKLEGIVATATTGTTTSSRDLRAITIGHIDRSLTEFGKGGITGFLLGDTAKTAADFAATTYVEEQQKLLSAINAPH